MTLMSSYLIKTGNADEFFNALRNAQAPERFTHSFLKNLEFASSTDRMYIGILKGLGFLDESGVPTERYFAFLDPALSRFVLADSIRQAYADLFAINRSAQELSVEEVRGKFKTLTRGQKSDNVINWMANTFRSLCELADWTESPQSPAEVEGPQPVFTIDSTVSPVTPVTAAVSTGQVQKPLELHYNIQIVLPDSRDQAVYDALFASLRKHLL